MVNSFSHYYPFTNIFVDLLSNFSIISLMIYFLLPILLMFIFVVFINKGYIYIRSKLLKNNIKSDYEVEGYRKKSKLGSLYSKEIRKYFSNSLYVINTAFGCIMLVIIILSILLFNDNLISRFSKMMDFNEMIKTNIFFILSILCVVSSTTNSSISLEGKSLWIMKSLPVNADTIFLSKIMVNLTVLIPTIIIGATFFGIYLHLPFSLFILLYLMPLAYSIFISITGLLLNLMFPKFEFDNEIRVIKQSLPVFLTMLIGVIVVLLPFKVLNNNSLVLITSIMFLIDIILAIILHSYGNRKVIRL